MQLITRARELADTLVDKGKAQTQDFQDGRRRKELLAELGELTYRKHCGDPIDHTAIDPVLADLDAIASRDTDDRDEPEAGAPA